MKSNIFERLIKKKIISTVEKRKAHELWYVNVTGQLARKMTNRNRNKFQLRYKISKKKCRFAYEDEDMTSLRKDAYLKLFSALKESNWQHTCLQSPSSGNCSWGSPQAKFPGGIFKKIYNGKLSNEFLENTILHGNSRVVLNRVLIFLFSWLISFSSCQLQIIVKMIESY